ncbi:MAG TPA: hypothetical protein VFY98_12980 [Intrasporangium sp.]|nr:hypothetical protein [Intrasporangium sp.]
MTHPDQSEQQLRRALRTMNDLQPPTDELFVQRAVIRGRARTNRRRNALLAAAAAFVVIASGGGAWLLQGGLPGATSASPASAPEVMSDQGSKSGADSDAAGSAGGREQPFSPGPDNVPVRPGVGSDWFVGPLTPQRAAIEGLAPELTTDWASTFSGAWAKDETNQRIVVALTHADLDLERWISANVRDATAVEFVTATHSYADKAALAARILSDSALLNQQGIVISTVTQDARADRVAVAASGTDAAARLQERYGADWVTVTLLPKGLNDTLSTPPPR